MFNKIEPPILLKILRCINHLSGDPNCLETLQRTDAIKHLIPILSFVMDLWFIKYIVRSLMLCSTFAKLIKEDRNKQPKMESSLT